MLLRNDFYSVLHCTAQLSSVHPIQRWHTQHTHRHSEQEYLSSFFLLSSLALIFFSPLSLSKLFSLSLFRAASFLLWTTNLRICCSYSKSPSFNCSFAPSDEDLQLCIWRNGVRRKALTRIISQYSKTQPLLTMTTKNMTKLPLAIINDVKWIETFFSCGLLFLQSVTNACLHQCLAFTLSLCYICRFCAFSATVSCFCCWWCRRFRVHKWIVIGLCFYRVLCCFD